MQVYFQTCPGLFRIVPALPAFISHIRFIYLASHQLRVLQSVTRDASTKAAGPRYWLITLLFSGTQNDRQ
jgi:hypothetical protein